MYKKQRQYSPFHHFHYSFPFQRITISYRPVLQNKTPHRNSGCTSRLHRIRPRYRWGGAKFEHLYEALFMERGQILKPEATAVLALQLRIIFFFKYYILPYYRVMYVP